MDAHSITNLVAKALALGAMAGLKATATQGVKDSYEALKRLLAKRYPAVSIDQLQEAPASTARRAVVAEDLTLARGEQDSELLAVAKHLLDVILTDAPETGSIVGITLDEVSAASLRISDLLSSGAGVKITRSSFAKDIEIHKVVAGSNKSDPKA